MYVCVCLCVALFCSSRAVLLVCRYMKLLSGSVLHVRIKTPRHIQQHRVSVHPLA